jgi:hypothetical protein
LARRIRPDLKVLFCSGYADISRFEEDIGDETLLKKPFRPDTPAEAVHTALHRAAQGAVDNVVCSCGCPKVTIDSKLSTKRQRNKPEKSSTVIVPAIGEVTGEVTEAQRKPKR